ncbi:MAG: CAP domain-containing protein [Chloroflexota bacterium]|nr:CAP domain-containing protein [Chloroflexota bacterium]MDE2960534.1 CAP domain-containing protein [Chloroflexota bacterium]
MARVLAIALVFAVIGGGIVYGFMLYLGRNPVQVNVRVGEVTATPAPSPSPTSAPLPTDTPRPAAALSPTPPPTPMPPAPLTPTAAKLTPEPTLTPAGTTEREIVVDAFAGCNGQYSGEEKRRRFAATNSAIDRGLHSVASVRALVDENCGGVFPHLAMVTQPTNTPTPTKSVAALPTLAPLLPVRIPTPVATVSVPAVTQKPNLRYTEEKRYMLSLINAERNKAGVGAITLGENVAAQLHAESALDNCFSSHWGIDGLKPYMRYSLAGGYQSNGENGSGLDYCITASDGYRANGPIKQEIRETMDGWMRSPGHRRNMLDPAHKRVNIGIAWDRYNTAMYQHFEGDYVEYDRVPSISNDVVSFSGTTKHGVRFSQEKDLGVQIYYDPPPHELARAQVARTYCYDNGRPVASLRWPLTGGYRWTTDTFSKTHKPCPSPYDVAIDSPAPRSPAEAHRAWQDAYDASQSRQAQSLTLPWITASSWTATGETFAVKADIGRILNQHGSGVYTVVVWGDLGGAREVISEYSIFHGVTPPDTYNRGN